MPRVVTWIAIVVAVVVVLAIAALAAVPWLVDTPRVQALIAANAAQALGRPVKFQSVSIRALPLPSVELHGLEVAEDPKFGAAPFLRLDSGRIRLKLGPLLTGRVELGDIVLKKPIITIIQTADGRLNIGSLGAGAEPTESRAGGKTGRTPAGGGGAAAALTSRISVDEGVVTYVSRGKGDALTQYRIEDLDLTLAGDGGQMTVKADARVKPGDLTVKIADGLVSPIAGKPLTEAPVRGTVAIDGKDVKDLVAAAAGPAPALGGAIKGTLALGGTVGAPTAAGDVQMDKLTVTQTHPECPEPKRRTLTIPTVKLNAAWQDNRFTGKPVTTSVADGTVTTQLTVSLDRGVRVQMADLGIRALRLEKVLVDYLCQGYAVTGPLDLTGAMSFEPRDLLNTLSGPGQFKIGSGKVVGSKALALIGGVVRVGGAVSSLLAADLPTRVFDSPLEFDSITGTYQITSGVARTRDLLYSSRAMKVLIAGEYGLASGRLDLDMTVNHGRGEVKAKVTGTTASPSIRVAPGSVLGGADRGKVQEGLQDLLKRFGR
jgi:hypothetical protein